MKSNDCQKSDRQKRSITQPFIKELNDREKAESKIIDPSVGSKPPNPPALYEDAGEGYNADFTFPQE